MKKESAEQEDRTMEIIKLVELKEEKKKPLKMNEPNGPVKS